MVRIDIKYTGDLHCSLTHGPSGSMIETDAPTDHAGKGEAFSPSDMVAGALGACMLTVMGIVAKRNGINMAGARATVVKEMIQEPVRRIGKLPIVITLPIALNSKERLMLETTAKTCPVHKSLHPDIVSPVEFIYA